MNKNCKKISLIMPTYNDSKTIVEMLNSIKIQSYENWELFIVNDGSTDDTESVVKKFILQNKLSNKIKYIYQENSDQLKAIINASSYITGDIVLIVHSDDILSSNEVLNKIITNFDDKYDAIIGNLTIIDEDGNITGTQHTKKYKIKKYIKPLQLLWLGRNLFVDVAVYKKSVFLKEVMDNYLIWNTPFWACVFKKSKILNVKNVSFSFINYRVFSENYINNQIGNLNVLNGEIRTVCNLMSYYNIPLYKTQYYIFRVLNKLNINYIPFYQNRETINKKNVIQFVIKKRIPEYYNNLFLKSIVNFFKNKNSREIDFNKIYSNERIYLGNEMKKFNKNLVNNTLSKFYYKFFDEMNKGFNAVIVNKSNYNQLVQILNFMGINQFVKIIIK